MSTTCHYPTAVSHQARQHRLLAALFVTAGLLFSGMGVGLAQDKPAMTADSALTLITETPEEGFALAVKLSQQGVATTQTDAEIRKALRPVYAHDPDSLIAVSHVVATHFQTIAAANNYWRE